MSMVFSYGSFALFFYFILFCFMNLNIILNVKRTFTLENCSKVPLRPEIAMKIAFLVIWAGGKPFILSNWTIRMLGIILFDLMLSNSNDFCPLVILCAVRVYRPVCTWCMYFICRSIRFDFSHSTNLLLNFTLSPFLSLSARL